MAAILVSVAAGLLIALLIHRSNGKAHRGAPATASIAARQLQSPQLRNSTPITQLAALPPEEIARVHFEECTEAQPFSFYISNQSSWMIFSFVIRVTVRNADGTVAFSRTIAMDDQGIEVYRMPVTAGSGLERMWITGGASSQLLQKGQTLSRTLISAKGYAARPQFMEQYDRANRYTEHRDALTGRRIVFDPSKGHWIEATQ